MEGPVSAAAEALRANVSSPLEANDLGRLAQLHTGCQELTDLPEPRRTLAVRLAKLLEALILSEAHDTPGGLALVPEAVCALLDADGDVAALAARTYELTYGEPAPEAPSAPPPANTDVTGPERAAAAAAPAVAAPPADPDAYVSEPLRIDLAERDHLQGFVDEAREHMDAIESALLEVERTPGDAARINELFRPFHTIKGIAGFLNLRDINRLTHEVETILDLGRKHQLELSAAVIDLVFASIDKLKSQIDGLAGHLSAPDGDTVPQPDIRDIMARLRRAQRGEASDPPPARPVREAPPAANDTAPANGEAPAVPGGTMPVAGAVPAPARRPESAAAGGPQRRALADTSIRVDTAKLDAIVDAVGELVIAQTMVNLNEFVRGHEKLARDVAQVTKIVRDIQESALAMRMVPIGPTFQKMRRVLRDVARKAGKQVELHISGEETELDKNVIQAISDPLVHMVRNSVDHGIEPPDERTRRGKPPAGTVQLNASYQGDAIIIEIVDDGRGLDREQLIAKAVERGIVPPGEALTDQQAYALIFASGFSTAAQVTDISGRGVGMDVVRRNIEQLRGKVEIESQLGAGSTFRIRLPLTLAIIDGMLVRVAGERLIIPTILIEQSLRPASRQLTRVQQKGQMIQVRGELLPLVQLGALFRFGPPADPTGALVVIVHGESGKLGLVVDELIGQQQVVIKSLDEQFKAVRGISGAAILGDGRVGLILEPTGVLRLHNERLRGPGGARTPPAARDPAGELVTLEQTHGPGRALRELEP